MHAVPAPGRATVNALSFDTLAFARRMEAVGFTRQQAEALAEEQAKLIDERLATKSDIELIRHDIEALKQTTKADIEALRQTTKTDIELIRHDIEALKQTTKADIEVLRQTTKADIEALRLATRADIETLRQTGRADLAEARSDIVKWTMGAIGLQTLLIVGAVVALARSLLH